MRWLLDLLIVALLSGLSLVVIRLSLDGGMAKPVAIGLGLVVALAANRFIHALLNSAARSRNT